MNIQEIVIKIEDVKDALADMVKKIPYDQLGQQELIERATELLDRVDRILGRIDDIKEN